MRQMILICLPFAGGHKYSYRNIENNCSELKLITLEYPGRGSRSSENLILNIEDLVEDLYTQLLSLNIRQDYALYGHSMGGLLGYLLLRLMKNNNFIPPVHFFISGTSGPSASRRREKRHLLDNVSFSQEIQKIGQLPDEILSNSELWDFIEPILRADFKICENYVHEVSPKLRIPMTVITGDEEDLTTEEILLWQEETTCKVDFIQLGGGHFFIFPKSKELINIFYEKLRIITL